MMREPFLRPCDFDDNGLVKVPTLFWVGLVVLARAWWLGGLVAMMTLAGKTFAGVLWPDIWFQLVSLAVGIPGLAMLFIYPLRGRWPSLFHGVYVLILSALFIIVLVDFVELMVMPPGRWSVGWMFLCLDIASVVMLWPDARLRAVFI